MLERKYILRIMCRKTMVQLLKVSIIDTIIGAFAMNEKGEIVAKTFTSTDINKLVERALAIEEGVPSTEFSEVLKEVSTKVPDAELILEREEYAREVSSKGLKFSVDPGHELVLKLRSLLPELAVEGGFIKSREEWISFVHLVSLRVTRMKLRKVAEKRDLLAIQAIRAIDDIDRTLNLFASRLREWYSIHFPELDDLIREHPVYTRIVYELGDRENIIKDKLVKLGVSEARAERIEKAAKESIGAELSDFDIKPIRTLANIMLELWKLRETLTEYVGQVMREVAPNITELVGPLLGARLLSLAGSLESLAKLPASTIQVLGAEKALFRALRTGGKPPKHGVIFQYPDIHRSPRWQRGKIARALATKLAIAARADYFTGRFIADRLKKILLERIEEIKKLYAKPPPRARVERPRPRRRRRRSKGK